MSEQVLNFNLVANIGGYGGYQVMTESIMRAFATLYGEMGLDPADYISLRKVAGESAQSPSIQHWLSSARKQVQPFHFTSLGILTLNNALDLAGQSRVLYPATECSILEPQVVRDIEENINQLWAASPYAARVFMEAGISPARVRVIPFFADTQRFYPVAVIGETPETAGHWLTAKRLLSIDEPTAEYPLKFLIVGKYENRKASSLAVRAFLEFFEDHPLRDCVKLYCKFSTTVYARQHREIMMDLGGALSKYPNAAKQVIELTGEIDMLTLYNEMDFLLMPSRSEGIGLPLLEASACGVPAIITPYAALEQYTQEGAHIILPDEGMIDAHDAFYGITPQNFGQWGQVTIGGIQEAFEKALEMTAEERWERGQNALGFVTARPALRWAEEAYNHLADATYPKRIFEVNQDTPIAVKNPLDLSPEIKATEKIAKYLDDPAGQIPPSPERPKENVMFGKFEVPASATDFNAGAGMMYREPDTEASGDS